MRRRSLLLAAACALPVLNGGAQSGVRALATTVTPARPYVGDLVECSVSFEPEAARPPEGDLDVPAPSGKPVQDVELVAASVRRKGGVWTYTARFIAWVPGSLRVPVPSSASFSLPEARVDIASAADDFGRSPPRYKDPQELPGTRLLVWGASGMLLFAALAAWSTAFGLLPWIRRLRRAWKEGRAGRDFGRVLDYLESSEGEIRPEDQWALLSKSLREYLAVRSRAPYRSYTSSEALDAAPEELPEGVAGRAAALLREGDSVRFARAEDGRAGFPGALEVSRDILRTVEEAARDGLR